jgi:hypothetical protein
VAEVETISLRGWTGGLNLAMDEHIVPPESLVEANDLSLGLGGELVLRKGAEVLPIEVDDDPETFMEGQDWIWHWFPADLEEPVFVTARRVDSTQRRIWWTRLDGTLMGEPLANDGSIAAQSFSYQWFPQAIVMSNVAYISIPGTTNRVYELESDTGGDDSTSITPWNAAGNTTSQFPAAGALEVAYERVFAANVSTSASVRLADRLFFSEPLLPKTWTTTNFIDIAPDEGTVITAIKRFADILLIFKENTIYGIAGTDFEGLGLDVYQIEGGIGCQAPGTIVNVGRALVFLDPAKGIFAYDGSAFVNIGEPIYPYIRFLIDSETVVPDQMHAWYHDSYYYLSTGNEVFAYSIPAQAWTRHRYVPHFTTSYVLDGVTYTRGVGDQGGVWLMHRGYIDPDGVAVEGRARTAWISPGTPALQHRLRGIEASVTVENQSFSIAVNTDHGQFPVGFENFAVAYDSPTRANVRSSQARTERWRAIQVIFDFWSEDAPWQA